MNSDPTPKDLAPAIQVGILVLNYHHPETTLACVRSLLDREGPSTRLLWLENDANVAFPEAQSVLAASGLPWTVLDPRKDPLPPAGILGVILNAENLGYGGGNNVGLRYLQDQGVPFAWVLNNDTLLRHGDSREFLAAASKNPEVALWGAKIQCDPFPDQVGGKIQLRDFAVSPICDPILLQTDSTCFVQGCSLFVRTAVAAKVGFLPEDYFLYYEDPAFSLEVREAGFSVQVVPEVVLYHHESLTTGRRSLLTEYYCRRNRWTFIRRYYPKHFSRQMWRQFYVAQRLLFRFKFRRLVVEFLSMLDHLKGRVGRTHRIFVS